VTGSALVVSSTGKLGEAASSAWFKEAIKPMDKTSEAILALKPTIGQPPFNVSNALQDPTLEVCDAPGALIIPNDNRQETQATNIQASGFAPPDPAEAAIIVVRPTGNTTAIVRGKNGARQADHLPHRAANEWRMRWKGQN
jgi:hypothetical protein